MSAQSINIMSEFVDFYVGRYSGTSLPKKKESRRTAILWLIIFFIAIWSVGYLVYEFTPWNLLGNYLSFMLWTFIATVFGGLLVYIYRKKLKRPPGIDEELEPMHAVMCDPETNECRPIDIWPAEQISVDENIQYRRPLQ